MKKLLITVSKQILKFDAIKPKQEEEDEEEEVLNPVTKPLIENLYCEKWEIDI